jgi:hypothetical protein
MAMMRERAYSFGVDNGLIGIASEPEQFNNRRPAVIILNAGLLHHVGQGRVGVTLARRLAEQGWYVLRFDLSSVGDSPARPDDRPIQERSVGEIREAMDFLQTSKGIDYFVLYGLCTGADNAYRSAVVDERICGGVLLEGYSYPTMHYYLKRYLPKLINPAFWIGKLKRMSQDKQSAEPGDVSYHWTLPPKTQVEQELKMLVGRGTRLLMIYTGSNGDYNYCEQFRDAFPKVDFRDCLQLEYFERGDHNVSMQSDKEQLFQLVGDWLQRSYLPQ